MPQFSSVREAKDFLAGRIAAQAMHEGRPLTEIERKMLYFSATAWTLPDMPAVSAEFKRSHDQDEYELKIGGLVGTIHARNDMGNPRESETWDAAVSRLRGEDHYLLFLIEGSSSARGAHKPGDLRRLWFTVIAVILGLGVVYAVLTAFVVSH